MGIVESVEDLTQNMELEMKDFDAETMQDNVFPWFHIVQWSSEELPTNTVLKWNYKSIKEKVKSLTLDKQTFLTNCPISKINGFSLEDDNLSCNVPFAEWAAALLSQMDELNNIRYELVPGRMSEEIFWQSYFNAIRNIVIKDVIFSMKDKQTNITGRKYKEINEDEITEESIPDFYKEEINLSSRIYDTEDYTEDPRNEGTGKNGTSLMSQEPELREEKEPEILNEELETQSNMDLNYSCINQERDVNSELNNPDNICDGSSNTDIYGVLNNEVDDYTNHAGMNSNHPSNSSDSEQGNNSLNDNDDHNSTFFSEEIPIDQE
ncbi:BSD domain-containing protein [Cryptosporidium felis]|nr:BSD domain-containing protein [Cryptosporidium felis]